MLRKQQNWSQFALIMVMGIFLVLPYSFVHQPLFGDEAVPKSIPITHENTSTSNDGAVAIGNTATANAHAAPRKQIFDISTAASFSIKKGLEPNIFYFEIVGKYHSRFAEATAGIQITAANTDALIKAMYTPLNNPWHKIGLSTAYHFSYLYNIGYIHDFLASFEYTRTIPEIFIFFVQMGYMHQWIRVPVPYNRALTIGQPSITLALHFTGIIKKEWFLGGGLSSYEVFRYPVFANPSLSIDLYYRSQGCHLPKGLYFGLEGILRYSDLFTFSGYVANAVIKSVIGMEL